MRVCLRRNRGKDTRWNVNFNLKQFTLSTWKLININKNVSNHTISEIKKTKMSEKDVFKKQIAHNKHIHDFTNTHFVFIVSDVF